MYRPSGGTMNITRLLPCVAATQPLDLGLPSESGLSVLTARWALVKDDYDQRSKVAFMSRTNGVLKTLVTMNGVAVALDILSLVRGRPLFPTMTGDFNRAGRMLCAAATMMNTALCLAASVELVLRRRRKPTTTTTLAEQMMADKIEQVRSRATVDPLRVQFMTPDGKFFPPGAIVSDKSF